MKTHIIAEVGINHNGDFDTAKKMIDEAKSAGCDSVKFQTYSVNKRAKKDSPIYPILKKCELTYDQQAKLKEHADNIGIEFFSTPFDIDAAKFLIIDLKVEKVKIASFDLTNRKLLKVISILRPKHIIMSVGMANENEIVNALCDLNGGYDKLSLLHCVSSYPMPDDQANLNAILKLRDRFSDEIDSVGYSDHSDNIFVPAASVLFGATIIEKHFTLSLDDDYPDNQVSADPNMMRQLVEMVRIYENVGGGGSIGLKECERNTLQYRRS